MRENGQAHIWEHQRRIKGDPLQDVPEAVIGFSWRSQKDRQWLRIVYRKGALWCTRLFYGIRKRKHISYGIAGAGGLDLMPLAMLKAKMRLCGKNMKRTRYLHRIRRTSGKGPMWLAVRRYEWMTDIMCFISVMKICLKPESVWPDQRAVQADGSVIP